MCGRVYMHTHVLGTPMSQRKKLQSKVWRREGVHQKHMKQSAFCPSVTCKTEKLCSIL